MWTVLERNDKRENKVIGSGLDRPNGLAFHKGTLDIAEGARLSKLVNIEDNLDNPPRPVVIYSDFLIHQLHSWKLLDISDRSAQRIDRAVRNGIPRVVRKKTEGTGTPAQSGGVIPPTNTPSALSASTVNAIPAFTTTAAPRCRWCAPIMMVRRLDEMPVAGSRVYQSMTRPR